MRRPVLVVVDGGPNKLSLVLLHLGLGIDTSIAPLSMLKLVSRTAGKQVQGQREVVLSSCRSTSKRRHPLSSRECYYVAPVVSIGPWVQIEMPELH